MFYSKSANGFFDSLSALPDDSLEISDEKYAEMIEGIEAGKVLSSDHEGYPVLSDLKLTKEQQISEVMIVKNGKIADAMSEISVWQTELQLGIISDNDKVSLINWLLYIKELQAVDTSTSPDVIWPMPPIVQDR
ncbi:TPA: tail fiber assembly protein [Escherichia coli]|uniref:Tail fiber assembly protein n=1 Tax=Escherichia coli TaxID=562 RepID=A0A7D7KF73_ECOLX|nr:tail fiber assembly protein [Escherichia coli]EFC7676497.1 tail fiber assembly protein [Escherichia coli]EFH5762339.1 phage tail protein [Escherichia coli]EFJ5483269.1 tail fiber assembly protein [Escherichia coli]EFN6162917.1 tail fiber assembly protein [Escherichia coli]EGL4404676.1 tail fiber assembly protein [Escherichia coli]